jgi:anti-sigma factor RsiW
MHLRDEDLEPYVLGPLSKDQASTIESHLKECADCRDRLAEVSRRLLPPGGERRRHLRISKDDPASLRVLNPMVSPGPRSEARVINASRGGLTLRVADFLEPGATVHIRLKDTLVFGEVRYCHPVGPVFHVGIQLQDTFATLAHDDPERTD